MEIAVRYENVLNSGERRGHQKMNVKRNGGDQDEQREAFPSTIERLIPPVEKMRGSLFPPCGQVPDCAESNLPA